jgi:hypothetical protein
VRPPTSSTVDLQSGSGLYHELAYAGPRREEPAGDTIRWQRSNASEEQNASEGVAVRYREGPAWVKSTVAMFSHPPT